MLSLVGNPANAKEGHKAIFGLLNREGLMSIRLMLIAMTRAGMPNST